MTALLFKRFCILRLHYYLLLWSIHRIYYDSRAVDSKDDEDEMDYLSLKALAMKLIGRFLVKQQIV